MTKGSGSIVGGMFLVSGSCIGAGMLGLPILSGITGYFPSLFMTIIAWIFMTFTALLLVEVTGWFKSQINIVSLAEKAFGNKGKAISWSLYLFLFYSLLVSYISVSSGIVSGILKNIISIQPLLTGLIFVIFLGWIIYFGTKLVDFTNRILMVGLIFTYLGMIFLGIKKIETDLLLFTDWKYLILPLPVLIISFGFHNMIPTLTAYLSGDLKKMRITILGGSVISLMIYIFWQTLVLGVVPLVGEQGLLQAFNTGGEATQPLIYYLNSTLIGKLAQWFAFFAIMTSFLAQALSLVHFIADGLKVKPTKKNNTWLIFLALLPPTFFTLTYPNVFLKALSFAGGFCAVILFGIFPALMAWTGRYQKKYVSSYHVSGGKTALTLAIVFSSFLVLNEVGRVLGFNVFIPY